MVWLDVITCARPEELTALKWCDLDEDECQFWIVRAIKERQ